MKKNGFTLAELLGVIVILSLISLITVPAITDSLQDYKKRLCNTQINEIVAAAKAWGADNVASLPDTGSQKTIYLSELAEYGYIDSEIQNPVTKENFDVDTTSVIIKKTGKKYTYTIDDDTLKSCE